MIMHKNYSRNQKVLGMDGMARLNIVYDLLQTTKISSNTIEDNEISQPIDKIFLEQDYNI